MRRGDSTDERKNYTQHYYIAFVVLTALFFCAYIYYFPATKPMDKY